MTKVSIVEILTAIYDNRDAMLAKYPLHTKVIICHRQNAEIQMNMPSTPLDRFCASPKAYYGRHRLQTL